MTLLQRHQNRDRRVKPGPHINHRNAHPRRSTLRVTIDAEPACISLHDGIVTGEPAERPIRPIAGNAAMDEFREFFLQHLFITETPFLHGAGLEVFDQHIRFFQQTKQYIAPGLLGQVEADRPFVAVEPDKVRGIAFVKWWAPIAHLVALRWLDLNNGRPMISKNLCSIRATQNTR